MAEAAHAKDGRLRLEPPCELGHRLQAMECPSCAERVTGKPSPPEWWTWYRRRYNKAATQPVSEPRQDDER